MFQSFLKNEIVRLEKTLERYKKLLLKSKTCISVDKMGDFKPTEIWNPSIFLKPLTLQPFLEKIKDECLVFEEIRMILN